MKSEMRVKLLVAVVALLISMLTAYAVSEGQSDSLATPESFASIADTAQRSAALFTELGKVLTHPRCVNCHPAGDRPRQGEQGRLHQPPVARGADGHGLPAMRCSICHQQANFEPGRVPGHPEWHLAPREMAWEGKTLARDLRSDQGPQAQWRPVAGRPHPSHRRRHAGRLGLGARLRPPARSRHAEAGRRACRGMGEDRRRVPHQREVKIAFGIIPWMPLVPSTTCVTL